MWGQLKIIIYFLIRLFNKKYRTQTVFTITKYGKTNTLTVGQKVFCSYYSCRTQNPYKITFEPFQGPKYGIIIGAAGKKRFWLCFDENKKAYNGFEKYLYVKFKEYKFTKAIPISCIDDAEEHIKFLEKVLERGKDKIGQKGYSIESYMALGGTLQSGEDFIYNSI